MTTPTWTDSEQGDLLELVALGTPQGTADAEWEEFVKCLRWVSFQHGGRTIYPNTLRPMIRGHIAPRRIGAFTNRALAQKLIEYTGEWEISDDHAGRNGGKPARVMRWIGGAA